METAISFQSGENILEGLYSRGDSGKGVVITHPHSLYGGDMENPVVVILASAFSRKGYSTLRFNFRGVGESGGSFDNGCGEVEDVLSAIRFLTDAHHEEIALAGYSFGARVIASIPSLPEQVAYQLHVAPPLAFMDYSSVGEIPKLQHVIAGEQDEIAPPPMIEKQLTSWSKTARLLVLSNCDHFFSGELKQLGRTVEDIIS